MNILAFYGGYFTKNAADLKDIPENLKSILDEAGYVSKSDANTARALNTILGSTAAGAGVGAIVAPRQRGTLLSGKGMLHGAIGGAAIGTGITAFQNRDKIKEWFKQLVGQE